jgi:hypothetical protein
MSTVLKYVSELRQKMVLLLIPQVTYEYVNPWWNVVDRRKLLIRPPELSEILPTESSSSKAV